MTMMCKRFYKVIVLKVDMFASSIVDEFHCDNKADAMAQVKEINAYGDGYKALVVRM